MPSAKSLTVKNLEALGAARLAELLLDIGSADPAIKRRLRLVLAGESSAADVAHEVRKRLSTLAKARSFVEGRDVKLLHDDLAAQHRAIVDVVGKPDPKQALELLWRFTELAEPTMQRCDDRNERLAGLFSAAAEDLAPLAKAAAADPEELAGSVFSAVRDNGHGQFEGLITDMAEPLGAVGLASLKQRLLSWAATAGQTPPGERRILGWGLSGPLYADDWEARRRDEAAKRALMEVADAEGDVEAFIAQYDAQARRVPGVAAEIAKRLLAAGRVEDAWSAIENVDQGRLGSHAFDWQESRIEVLAALARADEAQAFRWSCFAATLESRHLRAFLKGLPDFDDVEAEDRAMQLALGFRDVHRALHFLVEWPALDRASALVLARSRELNGDLYTLLAPAAEALDARYPLAATLVRRAMIDFTLTEARAKRYPHAARNLADCAAVAPRIAEYGDYPTHDAYLSRLKAAHGRKDGFWHGARSGR